jgi:large subunit ribosomal protein L3
MIEGIIGKKLGMTQVYNKDGEVTAVTAIEAGPCTVTQVKTVATDGYNAAQIGFVEAKKAATARKGQLKGTGKYRYLRELRLADAESVKAGQTVDVSVFASGDLVDIIGVSKGKGFAGGVKRYHFRGGPKTHGQSDRHRAPGASGPDIPDRVFRGHRAAGHMGMDQVTAKNLPVFQADPGRNLLLVSGTVPGRVNAIVLIRKSAKRK